MANMISYGGFYMRIFWISGFIRFRTLGDFIRNRIVFFYRSYRRLNCDILYFLGYKNINGFSVKRNLVNQSDWNNYGYGVNRSCFRVVRKKILVYCKDILSTLQSNFSHLPLAILLLHWHNLQSEDGPLSPSGSPIFDFAILNPKFASPYGHLYFL